MKKDHWTIWIDEEESGLTTLSAVHIFLNSHCHAVELLIYNIYSTKSHLEDWMENSSLSKILFKSWLFKYNLNILCLSLLFCPMDILGSVVFMFLCLLILILLNSSGSNSLYTSPTVERKTIQYKRENKVNCISFPGYTVLSIWICRFRTCGIEKTDRK